MMEEIKQLIDQEFGECLTTIELAKKYAELYCHMEMQLEYVLKCLTSNDEVQE